MEEQIRKSDADKLDEIVMQNTQLMDMLIQLAETTKACYLESENEHFKEVFKILNKTYCDAGNKIGMLNIDICTAKMNACMEVIRSNET